MPSFSECADKLARLVLRVFGGLFWCAFILAAWRLNWDIQEAWLWTLVPAGFLLVGVSTLPRYRRLAAMFVVWVGFTAYLLELASLARLSFNAELSTVSVARKRGMPFDERTQRDVFSELRLTSDRAGVCVPVATLLPQEEKLLKERGLFPLSGLSLARTVCRNETGRFLIYDADEFGFNNPPGSFAKAPLDVLLVGDSFAMGQNVMPSENVASSLRKGGRSTISLGQGWNGPLLELAGLREYGANLQPRHVIWMYFEGNDLLDDLRREQNSPILMRYLDSSFSQSLWDRQSEVDDLISDYALERFARPVPAGKMSWLDSHPLRVLRLTHLRRLLEDSMNQLELNSPPPIELFGKVIEAALQRTSEWGGEFVFVYLPTWERYAALKAHHSLDSSRAEVLRIVETLGIPIVDLVPVFLDYGDPMSLFPFGLKGHYNAQGYALVAQSIENYLESRSENPALVADGD